ncbi:MAG TPA: hypothetical protein VF615_16185 [Longimicrobiaceae bacterium]|jgi:hypothetical protein
MRCSSINFRRVLFGVSCTIVFGFGATEAFAERAGRTGSFCWYGDPAADYQCSFECKVESADTPTGWCDSSYTCRCSQTDKKVVVVSDP